MAGMSPIEPGEQPRADVRARRLDAPPSARYARPDEGPDPATLPSALPGRLAMAAFVAAVGAFLLVLVGAILAETFGLLLLSAGLGAAVGLVLSRAAAPGQTARPTPRSTVGWLAVGLAVLAVAAAAVATWIVARNEGGTLDLLDYLVTAFGPFVPAEAILAAIGARWGAYAGPVGR
jgi:hypothetical protein